jgi:dTDP-4-dehydrorhamnose reductase
MRILITGPSGLLGQHIIGLLSEDTGLEVFPLSRADWGDVENHVARVRPDVVIHCAACGMRHPRPDAAQMASFNVDESLRLFEISADATSFWSAQVWRTNLRGDRSMRMTR